MNTNELKNAIFWVIHPHIIWIYSNSGSILVTNRSLSCNNHHTGHRTLIGVFSNKRIRSATPFTVIFMNYFWSAAGIDMVTYIDVVLRAEEISAVVEWSAFTVCVVLVGVIVLLWAAWRTVSATFSRFEPTTLRQINVIFRLQICMNDAHNRAYMRGFGAQKPVAASWSAVGVVPLRVSAVSQPRDPGFVSQ